MKIPWGTNRRLFSAKYCKGDQSLFNGDHGGLTSCGGWIVGKAWAGCLHDWNDKALSAECFPDGYSERSG